MEIARRVESTGAALLALALCGACGGKSSAPPQRLTATGTASGVIVTQAEKTLRCLSAKGMVTVQGEGLKLVCWHIYKIAMAPTQTQANDALVRIVPAYASSGDTLVFDVVAPPAGEIYSYAAVTLGIPFQMDCRIEGAAAPVRVSDLFSTLTVLGGDSVSVARHSGSCDISLTRGGISLEVAVPESGHCIGRTEVGNIDLRLPAGSSAALVARTENGTVSIVGLVLTDRVDSTGYVSGTLGAGTAVVRLETKKGDITVTGVGR